MRLPQTGECPTGQKDVPLLCLVVVDSFLHQAGLEVPIGQDRRRWWWKCIYNHNERYLHEKQEEAGAEEED